MPDSTEALARGIMPAPIRVTIGERGGAAHTVAQRLVFVGREAGKPLALRQLLAGGAAPPLLAFVRSGERATAIHRCHLRSQGLPRNICAREACTLLGCHSMAVK